MKPATICFIMAMLIATSTAVPIRSRFLASMNAKVDQKKCHMDPSVCYGSSSCCGMQCVGTHSDLFNCGKCGKLCKFSEVCCGGKCVELSYDERHCGSCFNRCGNGIRCIFGMCNYA